MKAFVGFAGFGLVDIVLREAGFETRGVEIDPAIAEVNRANGGDVITADILTIDPAGYLGYDLAHFSPPCPNFSNAKQGEETELDISLGRWVARFVEVVQPKFFTLENVWAYRKSKSWGLILKALTGAGYGVDWWHLNAANYGTPQTRKRMIAIGRLDGQTPAKPKPTHRDPAKDQPAQLGLFNSQLPSWIGWYEAIADLIPTLPESEFAPWQLDRMPGELKTSFMAPVNGEGAIGFTPNKPMQTITARNNLGKYRAFLAESQNTAHTNLTIRDQSEPSNVVTSSDGRRPSSMPKAFVTASENGDTRAYTQGRVVSMTPRALARFQGIPDWFKLPGELAFFEHLNLAKILLDDDRSPRALAVYGIGNAVPPPLYRAVIKSLGEIR